MNHKNVQRLCWDEGLSLRLKRPRQHLSAAYRERQLAALRPNERWLMDFVSEALFGGYRLRALTVVDPFTREALAIEFEHGVKGEQVVAVVGRLALLRGAPCAIQVDNGPEFVSKALDRWAYENGVTWTSWALGCEGLTAMRHFALALSNVIVCSALRSAVQASIKD